MPGVRPEIWAFGFRNPWRMSFDRATGDLWVGDVGWELWEMVYKVKRGGNYGWSVMEGPQPVHVEGQRGPDADPAADQGPSPFRGRLDHRRLRLSRHAACPSWPGLTSMATIRPGTIWGLRCQGERSPGSRSWPGRRSTSSPFGEDSEGELYLVDHDRTHQIYRLVPNPAAKVTRDFPRRLSQTGLFASTRDHRPAAGVIPYSVNAELWADGATAERFLAVPGDGRIGLETRVTGDSPRARVLARTVSVERGVGPSRPAAGGSRPRSCIWRTMPGGPIRTSGTTTRPTPSSPMPRGTRTYRAQRPGGPRNGTIGSTRGRNVFSATIPGSRRRRRSSASSRPRRSGSIRPR